MRITLEADYAIRMIDCLTASEEKCCAKTLSEKTGVSPRFTLKILRKLCLSGLVCSRKGIRGGFELKRKPEEISLKDVIEAIDGPITVSRCQTSHTCNRVGDPEQCAYYSIFSDLSEAMSDRLASVTFAKNRPLQIETHIRAAEGRPK